MEELLAIPKAERIPRKCKQHSNADKSSRILTANVER